MGMGMGMGMAIDIRPVLSSPVFPFFKAWQSVQLTVNSFTIPNSTNESNE